MKNLLQLLEDDSTLTHAQLAAMTGMTEAAVSEAVAQYEKDHVILGYKTIVDWDRTQQESVTALIEVSVTPSGGRASTGWPSASTSTTRWSPSTSCPAGPMT